VLPRRPPRGDPVAAAGQVAVPLEAGVPVMARPHRRRRFAQTQSGIFFSRQCAPWGWGFAACLSTTPPHADAVANSIASLILALNLWAD
ncbi:unnamed protein product, partial [Urochloa humidicola]